MKNRLLLLISPLVVLTGVGATASPGINNFTMTPLYLNGDKTYMYLDVSANVRNPLKINVYIVNDLYPSGISIYQKSASSSSTLKFEYDNAYTRGSNNSVKVTWTGTGTNRGSIEHEAIIYQASTIKLNDEVITVSSTAKYLNYTKANGWRTGSEKITFYNFTDSYMPNYYHKIDLENFKLNVEQPLTIGLPYKTAILTVTNRNGVFNAFPHDKENAQFQVEIVGDRIYDYKLRFRDQMYVNEQTLEMSNISQAGYVPTHYLYLPRNEKRYEGEYKCNIVISDLGIGKDKFLTSFKYQSMRNIIGDCRSSEYCIVNT